MPFHFNMSSSIHVETKYIPNQASRLHSCSRCKPGVGKDEAILRNPIKKRQQSKNSFMIIVLKYSQYLIYTCLLKPDSCQNTGYIAGKESSF